MPSPFPGMDPYLEAPYIWPDLHERLAGQISTFLNGSLPAPYYACLEMRPEVGVVEREERRRIVPDVAVARPPAPAPGGALAVLEAPVRSISPSVAVTLRPEPIRHTFVEVRDPSQGHHLITLIEIVSPSNKQPGRDRRAYLQKQNEVLDSDASLIELDLLRTGERLLSNPFLEQAVMDLRPEPDYLVLVNRAWQRGGETVYQTFPVLMADPLPCIPVPLREGQEDTPLDLQLAFQRAYDSGPYRRGMVDYGRPPNPPLSGELAAWAEERLRAGRPPAS